MRRITLNPDDVETDAKFVPQFGQLDYDPTIQFLAIVIHEAKSPYYLADLPLFEHSTRQVSKGSCLVQRVDQHTWKVVRDGFFDKDGTVAPSIMPILTEIATYFVNMKEGETTFEIVLYECTPEEYIANNFVDCL